MGPTISVSPESPLLDEELTIRGTGFEPGERVRLVAEFEVLWGQFRGEATFETDESGHIDLTEQAPVAGDYEGVRPMGLVEFAELVERADDGPGAIADSHRLTVRAERNGDTVAESFVQRRALDSQVDTLTVEDEHEEFVGDLYLPSGDGPHPGVVVLGGSGGGVPAGPRAKLLASQGYAVLALAYFQRAGSTDSDRDDEHLPEELIEVPIEYTQGAIEWFRDHDRVQSVPVGVVGTSRGANSPTCWAHE
ncbi:acyl-CoA thioesterase/BAAT N-terminal domain-containing protein [Halomicroarcula sp. GCM10025894]|uniref:acyl-CoA thioesterase/BAAT N-terminal domain-containing protein n=1 Tax=Halomicroarcula sp. GCM10025894 TaxID=3252673 RepID=UPI00361EEB19